MIIFLVVLFTAIAVAIYNGIKSKPEISEAERIKHEMLDYLNRINNLKNSSRSFQFDNPHDQTTILMTEDSNKVRRLYAEGNAINMNWDFVPSYLRIVFESFTMPIEVININ